MVENSAFWWSCVDRNYFTIILQSSVGRGEAHIWVQRPLRKSPPDLKFRRPFSESSESSKSARDPSYVICTIRTPGFKWDVLSVLVVPKSCPPITTTAHYQNLDLV